MTAVLTGLREGELLGLQWGDLDWNASQIYIRRSYTGGRFEEPKTECGRRRVVMPSMLVAELKRWKLGCPIGALDLVFPNGEGNPENHSNLLARGFYPALRRAGLRKIRFHDLRHTAASLMIANGENIKAIQDQLGHASAMITLDTYGHLIPSLNTGMADRLADLALGHKTVTSRDESAEDDTQAIDLMVTRDGIEPPTRGFSVL